MKEYVSNKDSQILIPGIGNDGILLDLLKNGNENANESLLGRCFIEMAAHIDPRNEDAVFEYESLRIDSGELDWRLLTDGVKDGSGAKEVPRD